MKTKIFFTLLTLLVLFKVEFSLAQSDSIPREDGTKVAMPSIGQVMIVTKKDGSIKKCFLREINPDNIVYEIDGCLHDLLIEKIGKIEMKTMDVIFFDENKKPMIKSPKVKYNSGSKQTKEDSGQNQIEYSSFNKCKHLIGFAAGFTTGCGVSYRLYYKDFGAQVTLSPSLIFKNNRFNLGLTLLGRISETKRTNTYFYFSNSFSHKQVYNYTTAYDSTTNQNTYNNYQLVTKNQWNSGLGVDFEFNTKRRVRFNLMLGLGAYDSLKHIYPATEFGIHYKI
jgi:hypothetical protein